MNANVEKTTFIASFETKTPLVMMHSIKMYSKPFKCRQVEWGTKREKPLRRVVKSRALNWKTSVTVGAPCKQMNADPPLFPVKASWAALQKPLSGDFHSVIPCRLSWRFCRKAPKFARPWELPELARVAVQLLRALSSAVIVLFLALNLWWYSFPRWCFSIALFLLFIHKNLFSTAFAQCD